MFKYRHDYRSWMYITTTQMQDRYCMRRSEMKKIQTRTKSVLTVPVTVTDCWKVTMSDGVGTSLTVKPYIERKNWDTVHDRYMEKNGRMNEWLNSLDRRMIEDRRKSFQDRTILQPPRSEPQEHSGWSQASRCRQCWSRLIRGEKSSFLV